MGYWQPKKLQLLNFLIFLYIFGLFFFFFWLFSPWNISFFNPTVDFKWSYFWQSDFALSVYKNFFLLFLFMKNSLRGGSLQNWGSPMLSDKESACQAGDMVHPWPGKISWRRKGMATHSSILAWNIPWTEEPSRLQSMGSGKIQRRLSNWTATTLQNTAWTA